MVNHGAAALLLIASLVLAVALSGADARPVVRPSAAAALHAANTRHTRRGTRFTVRRDTHGGYVLEAMPPVAPEPELTCNKVHGVKAGETCFSMAQETELTLEDFLGLNPNVNCNNLFVGQWVCLDVTSGC